MIDIDLRRLSKTVAKLGVPDVLGPVVPLLDRQEQITASLVAARSATDRVFASAVSEMIETGQVTTALVERLAVVPKGPVNPVLERAAEQARAVLGREALKVGRPLGPQVFAALRQVAVAAVGRVTAVKVPAVVVDERTAFDARMSVDEWDELLAAARLFELAHTGYAALRGLGWVPAPESGGMSGAWLRYGNPLLAPLPEVMTTGSSGHFERVKLAPPLLLVRAVAQGARPGMLTFAEAQAGYRRYGQAVEAANRLPKPEGPVERQAAFERLRVAVDGPVPPAVQAPQAPEARPGLLRRARELAGRDA